MTTGQVQNHFSLLGLPESCEIDAALLERNYRQLQARWHPDRFATGTPAQRLAALQQASLLNDAYATLKTPLRRAGYLLQLNGVDVHKPAQLEGAFLLDQLEQREDLEQFLAEGNESGLVRLLEHTRGEQAALWREFAGSAEAGRFAGALAAFHKLQFLTKLGDEILSAEDRLLDRD